MAATKRARVVLCEKCRKEPAISFSYFGDRIGPMAPEGLWRFTGMCTADSESYYILFRSDDLDGFLQDWSTQANWWRHMRTKTWFNARDFQAALDRFVEAGGTLLPILRWTKEGLR